MELYLRIDRTVQFVVCEVNKIVIYEEVPLQDSLKYLYSNLFGMNMDSVYVFTHGSIYTDGEEHTGLCVSNTQIIENGQRVNCSVYEPDDNVINIYYLCYLLMFDKITFIDESNLDVLVEGVVCHRRYGDGYLVSFRSGADEFVDYAEYSNLAIKLAEFGTRFHSNRFCDLDHLVIPESVHRVFSNVRNCLQLIEEDHPADVEDAKVKFEHFLVLCVLPSVLQNRPDFEDVTYTVYGDDRQPNYVETAEDYKAYLESVYDEDGFSLQEEEESGGEDDYSLGILSSAADEDSSTETEEEPFSDSSSESDDPYSNPLDSDYQPYPEDSDAEGDLQPPSNRKQKKAKGKKQPLPVEEDFEAGETGEDELLDLDEAPKKKGGLKILVILLVVIAISAVAAAVAFNVFSKRDAVVLNAQISDKQIDLEEQQAIYEHYENYMPNSSELIKPDVLHSILELEFPGYLGEIQFLEESTVVVLYLTTPDDLDKVQKIFTSVGELKDVKSDGSVALKNGVLYKYTFSF